MIEQLPDVELPRPAPVADAGPLDDRLYDLVETRVRRLLVDNPIARDVPRHPHRGPPARRRRAATPCSARSPPTARTSRRSRRSTPPGSPRRRASSATSSSTTSAWACSTADEVRRWERRSTAAGELGDAVFLLFARGAAPLARADRADRRPARRGAGVPRAGRRPARRDRRSRSGSGPRRATPRTCRACSPRSGRRPIGVLDGCDARAASTGRSRAPTPPSRRTAPG